MPAPALLVLVLSVATAAADQIKENRVKSAMAKTTSPRWLSFKSSEQEGIQKDHPTYKCLWEKEKLLLLKNGKKFDLKSETRASTYKNKKLLLLNRVLKFSLYQEKQANNGIRKAALPQRRGKGKVIPALRKTRVSALVRKTSLEKQKNVKVELQKELENDPSRKIRLPAKTPLQIATEDLDWLARKWRWLKGAFLKAPLNTLVSIVRKNQGIKRNPEKDSKPQKDNLSSGPFKPETTAQEGIRTWKLYNLRIVYKHPCKSVNSERTPIGNSRGEPEKDKIILKALCGRLGSLNTSANGDNTWRVKSRKRYFGCHTKMNRKGLPTSLTSRKTESMAIQRTQRFGNRVILTVTEYVHIPDDNSRDPYRRQNSTESIDSLILSRNESQETKSSISDFIQKTLKFLFKMILKDREHRIKIWPLYGRVPLQLRERKANTFQRKIDRLVNQDGSQTDPRVPNRKPEVAPGAPALEDEGKAPQWIRFAPFGELSKRRKRDADEDDTMAQVSLDFLHHLSSLLGIGVGVIAVAFIVLSIVVGILFYKRRELFQVSRVTVTDRKSRGKSSSTITDPHCNGLSLSRCFHSSGLQASRGKELELQEALQKSKRRDLDFVMTSITSDTSDNGRSMTPDRSSLSSSLSLISFYSQSLEISRDWFSDEEGSSMKSSLMDRVQVYLDTMDTSENLEQFQCGMAVNEDQKHLVLEKANQQKMQMPQSVSIPLEVSSGIPCPLVSKDDPSKVSNNIPPQSHTDAANVSFVILCPPQLKTNALKTTPDILDPPKSKERPSRPSTSILLKSVCSVSKAASEPQLSKT
ncbi:uncharacterized protein C1orf185 homolog [Antechinus flavipes]|uniref:uncharacterized protein C1orf185 homolog n=1 Tax=Antechinus flavipes TaxID=38775 RepID=UPI00223684D7|nr:uncharacterized protein C1orf185 homolog [Antechinus flavipes]